MSQVRRFAFTWFIDDDSFDALYARFPEGRCLFLVAQRERCPSTQRLHWQAYARLSGAFRFTTVKTWLPGAHLSLAKGNEKQNITYCTKEDSRVAGPYQRGEPSCPGKRSDIDSVRESVRSGKRLCQIADEVSSYQALRFAEKYITLQPVPERDPPVVYWFHGSTGGGKTREAWSRARSIGASPWCSHDSLQWFDGYTGQEYVIIDDFRGSTCKFCFLLKLLDRYPLMVPIKGGYVRWQPTVIVITSPLEPQHVYNKSGEDIAQLVRRIDFVEQFGSKVLAPDYSVAAGFISV